MCSGMPVSVLFCAPRDYLKSSPGGSMLQQLSDHWHVLQHQFHSRLFSVLIAQSFPMKSTSEPPLIHFARCPQTTFRLEQDTVHMPALLHVGPESLLLDPYGSLEDRRSCRVAEDMAGLSAFDRFRSAQLDIRLLISLINLPGQGSFIVGHQHDTLHGHHVWLAKIGDGVETLLLQAGIVSYISPSVPSGPSIPALLSRCRSDCPEGSSVLSHGLAPSQIAACISACPFEKIASLWLDAAALAVKAG